MKKRVWDEARALQLLDAGMTDIEIADMVGASAAAIGAWRRSLGRPANRSQPAGDAVASVPAVPQPSAIGWIDIRDRLPEENQQVIAVASRFARGLIAETRVIVAEFSMGGFEFFLRHDGGYLVSHWMPLPSPPKEGGE